MFQDSSNEEIFIRTSLNGRIIKICKYSSNCPLKKFITILENNLKNKCGS